MKATFTMPAQRLKALIENSRLAVSGDEDISHVQGLKLEVMFAIGNVAGDGDDCLIAVEFESHEVS